MDNQELHFIIKRRKKYSFYMEEKLKLVCFGCMSDKCIISIFLKTSFYFMKKWCLLSLLYLASEKSGPIIQ